MTEPVQTRRSGGTEYGSILWFGAPVFFQQVEEFINLSLVGFHFGEPHPLPLERSIGEDELGIRCLTDSWEVRLTWANSELLEVLGLHDERPAAIGNPTQADRHAWAFDTP